MMFVRVGARNEGCRSGARLYFVEKAWDSLHYRDMRLAGGMAEAADCVVLKTVTDRLAAAESSGHADEDFAALAKLLE